jgi:4'-phosphopantetheinyl transferase
MTAFMSGCFRNLVAMGMSAELWDSIGLAAHVWRVDPGDLDAAALAARWLGVLHVDERSHYERLETDLLRHSYLTGCALVRATLSRYSGVDASAWKFVRSASGKPAVVAPAEFASIRFNLTHTDGLVACLVTRAGEVGVDAEKVTSAVDVDAIVRHFFTAAECNDLDTIPPQRRLRRFFEYWVVKEAWLKGRGVGVVDLPELSSIEWDSDGQPLPQGQWQLKLHDLGPQYAVATAVQRHGEPVSIVVKRAEDLL